MTVGSPMGATDPRFRNWEKSVSVPGPRLKSIPGFDAMFINGPFPMKEFPADDDLDRLAAFVSGYNYLPGDVGVTETEIGRWEKLSDREVKPSKDNAFPPVSKISALLYWFQLHAIGWIQEDWEGNSWEPILMNWPNPGDNRERRIYGYVYQGDKILPGMQIQKWNSKTEKWEIFNANGQDRYFVKNPDGTWSAGFDFGKWLRENVGAIATAFQTAFAALAAVFTFGAGASFGVAMGAAMTAQRAATGALVSAASGDWGNFINGMVSAGTAVANIPTGEGKTIGTEFLKNVQNSEALKVAQNSEVFKTFASIAKDADSLHLPDLIKQASKFTGNIPPETFADIKKSIPPELNGWFQIGYSDGIRSNFGKAIPEYANAIYTIGATLGAANQPHKASRFRPSQPIHKATRLRITPESRINPPSDNPKGSLLNYVKYLEVKWGLL